MPTKPAWAQQPPKKEDNHLVSAPEYQFDEASGKLAIVFNLNVEGKLSSKGKSIILGQSPGRFETVETPWGDLWVNAMVLRPV